MTLVTRNHPRLTLEGARAVLAAAEAAAVATGIAVIIAAVDEGGHLLAFARMDGAKPSSVEIALVKARAAALRRSATGPYMEAGEPNLRMSLGLAAAAPAYQTPLRGGVPLVVDSQVVGGIGVSAGTEQQDLTIARAGAAVLGPG
jgi:glc operon protein GlcG